MATMMAMSSGGTGEEGSSRVLDIYQTTRTRLFS